MNATTWLSDWLSKRTFWQFNAALGLAFMALYVFHETTTHHFMYRFQVSLSDWAEQIGLASKFELLELMIALTAFILFLAIRYGKFAEILKMSAATVYILLAANVSILLYLTYGAMYPTFPITEQLSAYGLGGLLSVMTRTCLTLAAISFLIPLIWHYGIKPQEKLKALTITLLKPQPDHINDVQPKQLSKRLAIGILIGLVLMILSIYKQEIVKYIRLEKEVFTDTKIAIAASSTFNIANWRNAITLTGRALNAEKDQHWSLAVSEWSRLNKTYPDDANVLSHRAAAYHELGMYEQARQDFKEVILLQGNDASALTSYCWNTVLTQNTRQAIAVCTKSEQFNPWIVSGALNLGHAYLLNSDLKQATHWYDKAIKLATNEEDLQEILGDFKVLKSLNIPATQLEQLHTELETKGRAWLATQVPMNAVLKQAEDAEKTGQYQEATSLYLQYFNEMQNLIGHQSSQNASILAHVAIIQSDMGAFKEAEDNFNLAQSLVAQDLGAKHAKMTEVLNGYAYMLSKAGRYEEAIQAYQKAIAIAQAALGNNHPQIAMLQNGLGSAYRQAGQFDQAQIALNNAVDPTLNQLLPDYQMLAKRVNNLGLLYENMGAIQAPRYYFTQALEMTELSVGKNHIDVCQRLHNLGKILVKLKEYDEAEQLFRRALQIADNTPTPDNQIKTNAILDMAQLLSLIGKKEEAKQYYDRIKIVEETS